MHIGSSRNTILKLTATIVARNANGPRVSFEELEQEVAQYQKAGVSIYGSHRAEGVRLGVREDVARLERLRLLKTEGEKARLTGAGQLWALNLEFPKWVEQRLERRAGGAG